MNATARTMVEDLIAAQQEMPALEKNAVNPHFHSRFADLAETLKVKATLNKHGFFVSQPTVCHADGRVTIKTVFLHKSGGFVEGEWPVQPARANDPQAMGSAVTYARRYSLQALAGLVADDDDDGNAASAPPPRGPAGPRAERRPMSMRQPGPPVPSGTTSAQGAPTGASATKHTEVHVPPKGPLINQAKLVALHAAMGGLRLGVAEATTYREAGDTFNADRIERSAGLAWISGHLGRHLTTSKDVTDSEASRLIDLAKGGIFPQ